MAGTSWQDIRTFDQDVPRTLEQLRSDVFAGGSYYLADEPVNAPPVADGSTATRLAPPSSIAEALQWNGSEGTHSALDITRGIAARPTHGAVSPLAPTDIERCFGSTRPTLFDVLMVDFDAVDVCEPGTGRYFLVISADERTLVVFVGLTGE